MRFFLWIPFLLLIPSALANLPSDEKAAQGYFTDTELIDQEGKSFRFYSDLLRGNQMLINFAFTSCKGGCSPITQNLAKVQRKLGPEVGRRIRMVTLSVDPANDTPEHLRRFARKFKAGPGWHFLSGRRENVELVLKKLGGYTPNPDNHSMVLLIGDARTGVWVKAHAMDPPDKIAKTVRGLND